MEMRKLSLRADLLGDKKVDYNLYGHLQAMSYLKDGKRFVYASDATPKKLEEKLTPAGATKPIISNSTIKRGLALFQKPEINLITAGTVEDLHGKTVKCYWLNEDENYFQLINLETLRFLCDVANSDVIKTYAYLLNKSFYFEGYTFTKKELLDAIGYSSKDKGQQLMDDILLALSKFGLIKFESCYERNYDGNPVPKMRLLEVKTKVER